MSPAAPVRRAEEEGCSRQVEEGRMPSDGRGVVAGGRRGLARLLLLDPHSSAERSAADLHERTMVR